MKILKIKDSKGYFSLNGENYFEIDNITKDNLVEIVNLAFDNDFEYDENVEEVKNEAQIIIYRKILEKCKDLVSRKESIKSKINNKFSAAEEKYTK